MGCICSHRDALGSPDDTGCTGITQWHSTLRGVQESPGVMRYTGVHRCHCMTLDAYGDTRHKRVIRWHWMLRGALETEKIQRGTQKSLYYTRCLECTGFTGCTGTYINNWVSNAGMKDQGEMRIQVKPATGGLNWSMGSNTKHPVSHNFRWHQSEDLFDDWLWC